MILGSKMAKLRQSQGRSGKNLLLVGLAASLFFLFALTALQASAQVNISPSLPTGINGTPVDCSAVGSGDFSTCNPGALIKNIYQFSLLIAGVLALGAIVYGGITYTISAGNPSKQHEGTEWIRSALWGLLLLASAYLILNTIDPRLTSVGLPGLTAVGDIKVPTPTTTKPPSPKPGVTPPDNNPNTTGTGGSTCADNDFSCPSVGSKPQCCELRRSTPSSHLAWACGSCN